MRDFYFVKKSSETICFILFFPYVYSVIDITDY